jgi:hypothetical protein
VKPTASNRQLAIFTLVGGTLLAVAASFAHPVSDTELSAEAQMLPTDLVQDLKTDPPSRGAFGDRIFCKVHTRPMQSPSVPYCMCYGASACAELSTSGRCNSRLGWFNQDTMAACRANGNQPYGAPEPVTITG